jgi:hypothetical protein
LWAVAGGVHGEALQISRVGRSREMPVQARHERTAPDAADGCRDMRTGVTTTASSTRGVSVLPQIEGRIA